MLCGLTLDTMFVNDKAKKNNYNSRVFIDRGFYSVMIEHQLIPILLGRPYVKTEKTKHNTYQRWVAPIGMAYEVETEDGLEWYFPIFTSVQDFKKSMLGKSLLSANKWWKPEGWEKTFTESNCQHFTPIVPIAIRGPTEGRNLPVVDRTGEDYIRQSGYKADADGKATLTLNTEAGKLSLAPYPTFIVPTPVDTAVNPMTGRGGGRYHNIHPISEMWLRAYSEAKLKREFEKPHRTKTKTSYKGLTKKEIPLLPKQLFMEQYARKMNKIVDIERELFYIADGKIAETLIGMGLITPEQVNTWKTTTRKPQAFNEEITGAIMRSYLSNIRNQQINSTLNEGMKESYNIKYHDGSERRTLFAKWPLTFDDVPTEITDSAIDKKDFTNIQPSISLPRLFTYYTFDGGQIDGTPNPVEYWPESPEGYVNYSYLDFLTPSIWEME
jgi:hypothetical protein